jgi:ribosomal protein S18 acetylase RimI-like enzyme
VRLCARPPAPELGDPAVWFPHAYARAAAGRGAVLVVEAFVRGRPRLVACGTLALWPHAAEIAELQVVPEWRGRGIGTALVAALEAEARRLQAARVELGVAAANLRARALYARLGYADAQTVAIDLGHGPEAVVVMAKDLSG